MNNKLSSKIPVVIWTDETSVTINPDIKFPKNKKLIVPISNVIISIIDILDCANDQAYEWTLNKIKNLVSDYPIVISLQKEDYHDVLDDFNSETMIDMFKFVMENSPKDLVEWEEY